jgi:hypothetical protein
MKNPIPRVFDIVEKIDFSRTDGYVKKLIDDKTVLVSWYVSSEYDDNGILIKDIRTEELVSISSLAIIKRP